MLTIGSLHSLKVTLITGHVWVLVASSRRKLVKVKEYSPVRKGTAGKTKLLIVAPDQLNLRVDSVYVIGFATEDTRGA